MVSSAEGAVLFVPPGSHNFVFYSVAPSSFLVEKLVLEYIMILEDSVSIGHAYSQLASAEMRNKHCLHYEPYFIAKDVEELDAIAFMYQTGLLHFPGAEEEDAEEVQKQAVDRQDSSISHKIHATPFLMAIRLKHLAGLVTN